MPFPSPGLEFPQETKKVDRRQLFVLKVSENTTVDSIPINSGSMGAVTMCSVNYQVRKQSAKDDPSMDRLPIKGKPPKQLPFKTSEKRPPSSDVEYSKLSKKT
ncbi:hypothetical protein PsorP6_014697 [Peronosclerospora sorghi]|uniref:Uncharacterized protein n=1 Tax=Peronosclerospora sorghi TaxID=230839 RepID=A0ACC0VTI0_9STRA|nr:hypothetical protein PsorP6_014697 [Peronosclerospora sorghi]